MKLRKITTVALAIFIVLTMVFSGCGSQNSKDPTPPSENQSGELTPDSDNSGSSENDKNEVIQLSEMLGKSDENVKALFGGGTENKSEDGSILLGRSYETTISDNAAVIETVYDENNTVASLSVSFSDISIEEIKAIFTKSFGEPETVDETQDFGPKYYVWKSSNVETTLNESYGIASAQMTLIK